MKHSEKFIFLFVVIGAIFFARFAYPSISGVPSIATINAPQTADAEQAVTAPPTLVLPQTSLNGADAAAIGNNNTPATGVIDGDSVPVFKNQAYMVADLATGNVAVGSNTAKRWPTASLTKLMTATLVLDELSPTTTITISPQMFAADPDEKTLVIGGTYHVEDLLHLLLMPSSNVAAQALADYIGQVPFMNAMNQRAASWGMTDTYFADPSGISAANQSTANDLLILAQHLYQHYPQVLALTNTPVTTITELNSGKKITVRSINIFAGTPGFIGGKTGNTEQADANLLSIFNDNGQPIFITVLGAPGIPFQDTTMLYDWYKENNT
jgi:D-alanyl-D-alanine carboxypeptidase (penicillin-binding protein 5/6)